MDKNSLAHTMWECKYHIVFALKFRRQSIYGDLKKDIGKILRELCERKGIEIIEAELMLARHEVAMEDVTVIRPRETTLGKWLI